VSAIGVHRRSSGSGNANPGGITPAGHITEFSLPAGTPPPLNLTVGPDGNLWFTSAPTMSNDMIGRITPQGAITEFPDPTFDDVPGAIVAGSDGNLWFVTTAGSGPFTSSWGAIGRITPAGHVTEFRLPNQPDPAAGPPTELTSGPDGNVWFVAGNDHMLGRITPQGAISEFPLPAGITLGDITLGPDGNLWFTDTLANTIDRIELHR
jgi:virginiamycin B lyase